MENKFDEPPSAPSPVYLQSPPPPPYSDSDGGHLVKSEVEPLAPSQLNTNEQPTVFLGPATFGAYPQNCICPNCNRYVVSVTKPKPGTLTYLASAGCCIIGGLLGCFLIFFCTDFTQDVIHLCPECQHEIGKFNRL